MHFFYFSDIPLLGVSEFLNWQPIPDWYNKRISGFTTQSRIWFRTEVSHPNGYREFLFRGAFTCYFPQREQNTCLSLIAPLQPAPSIYFICPLNMNRYPRLAFHIISTYPSFMFANPQLVASFNIQNAGQFLGF